MLKLNIPFVDVIDFKKRFVFEEAGYYLMVSRIVYDFMKMYDVIDSRGFYNELYVYWGSVPESRALLSDG